jgi:hypothetical protein
MAFLLIPICYVESDPSEEEEDNEIAKITKKHKKPPTPKEADVTININQICSFVGVDETDHTMIYMADRSVYECILSRDKFEDLIVGADAIIDLTTIREN